MELVITVLREQLQTHGACHLHGLGEAHTGGMGFRETRERIPQYSCTMRSTTSAVSVLTSAIFQRSVRISGWMSDTKLTSGVYYAVQ